MLANTADSADTVPARTSNGRVYVLPGKATTIDAGRRRGHAGDADRRHAGPAVDRHARAATSNADGVADIAVGAYTDVAFGRSTASGASFRRQRRQARRWSTSPTPPSSLFTVGGAFAGHRLGIGVGAASVTSTATASTTSSLGADSTAAANSDAAYVIFGAATRHGASSTPPRSATRGYRILGAPGSSTGYAVAAAGDVNHDGAGDVLVGGYGAGSAGRSWVVYGVRGPDDAAGQQRPAASPRSSRRT